MKTSFSYKLITLLVIGFCSGSCDTSMKLKVGAKNAFNRVERNTETTQDSRLICLGSARICMQ